MYWAVYRNVASTIETAQSAKNGLERKLQEASAQVSRLKDKSADVLQSFLAQEAESVAQDYIEAARQIQTLYIRLRAINGLIRGQGGPSINGPSLGRLFIPTFALPQFEPVQMRHVGYGVLYSAEHDRYGNTFEEAEKNEKDHFKELGVKF